MKGLEFVVHKRKIELICKSPKGERKEERKKKRKFECSALQRSKQYVEISNPRDGSNGNKKKKKKKLYM